MAYLTMIPAPFAPPLPAAEAGEGPRGARMAGLQRAMAPACRAQVRRPALPGCPLERV